MSKKDGNDPARFLGALTMIFIFLKVKGLISWDWVWVLSPLWIITAVGIVGVVVSDFTPKKEKST